MWEKEPNMSALLLRLSILLVLSHASALIFGGRELSQHQWSALNDTVNCWTKSGKWTYVERNPKIIINDKSLTPSANYVRMAPCTGRDWILGSCLGIVENDLTDYHWVADQCTRPYLPFSAVSWCHMREQLRNILIVGDSMNAEHFFGAIENELAIAFNTASFCFKKLARKGGNIDVQCPGVALVGKTLRVKSIRNDGLSVDPKIAGHVEHFNDFMSVIGQLNNPVVILNRGAHFTPDAEFLPQLRATFTALFQRYPNATVIYRNTPFGANNHEAHFNDKPLSFEAAEAYPHDVFNYDGYDRQNRLAQQLIEAHFPQVLYLDMYTSTIQRIDSHQDPLHYCFGSAPMKHWVQLLFNVLHLVNEI